MDRRSFLVASGAGISLALAGCLDGSGTTTAGGNAVEMTMDSFRPEELTVDAGTTVEFSNTSSHTHTVTAFQDAYPDGASYWASGGFDTEDAATQDWESGTRDGALETGDSYEHTFERAGTYDYYCIPHLGADMVGTIVVEAAAESGGNGSDDDT